MSSFTNYKAELVGVLGQPIAENPTIVMIEAAFKAKGLNWRYQNFEVGADDLAGAITGVRALGLHGINLTIPHKIAVLAYLDEIAVDAVLIGAVNTVRREGNRLIGENTDGKGFLRSLREDANLEPVGKKVVILGAGGAARAISVELALAGASQITIINRSQSRGQALVDHLNEKTTTSAQFISWASAIAIAKDIDILVNATSIGLYPDIDDQPNIVYETISANMLVCDVIPNPPRTPFLREAEARGAKTLNGLGMLVYQGAIGFTMWTGLDAPVEVMHQALAVAFE